MVVFTIMVRLDEVTGSVDLLVIHDGTGVDGLALSPGVKKPSRVVRRRLSDRRDTPA